VSRKPGAVHGLFRYVNFNDQITIDDANAGTGEGDLFGHEMLSNINVVGAANVLQDPPNESQPVADRYSSYGPGELLFSNSGSRLATPKILTGVSYVAPDGSGTSVPGFAPFDGTSAAGPVAAAIAALMLQKNPGLTSAQITADLAASAIAMSTSGPQVGAGFIQATTALQLASCFCPGTMILTDRGEVPVDALHPGDVVVAADARGMRRIERVRWIGGRTLDLATHPDPDLVAPIRICAGAIAPNLPRRDLVLSPDHCVLMRRHLLRAFRLINGVSVVQEHPRSVTYLHVEFDRHALLFAEGLPAESYLDEGFRGFFDGASASPGTLRERSRLGACAPFVSDDALAERIWRSVARRAKVKLATHRPAAPALRVLAGERLLRPIVADDRRLFTVPRGTAQVRLLSGTSRPTDSCPWSEDRRRLGVSVRRIATDGIAVVPLDSPALGRGWHAPQPGPSRWTDGDAQLALSPNTRLLEVRLTA
jgi:Hint domain/Subtilase family